jgi:cell division septation protein DedD
MDEGAKRRLVGAAVLVALAVIFVPMLLNDKDDDGLGEPIVIPDSPAFDAAGTESGDDLTPLLPSPESPTAGRGPSVDFADGSDSLPTPLPPGQNGASDQSTSQPAFASASQ